MCCILSAAFCLNFRPSTRDPYLNKQANMIFSKALATVFAFAGTSLAQSLSGWSQTTIMIGTKTTVMLLPTSLPDLSGTIMSCTVSQGSGP